MPGWSRKQYESDEDESARKRQERLPKPWHWFNQPDPVARFTLWLAIFTLMLIVIAAMQSLILFNQLRETQYEQRPWVFAEIGPGGPILRNQSGGLTIQVGFKFHNTGHLPALYVSPDLDVYLSGDDGERGGSYGSYVRERQKRRCDGQFQQPLAGDQVGVTVFPGQDVKVGIGKGIDARSIDKAVNNEMGYLIPWVVGCIRYRAPGGDFHQTGVAFQVLMSKPGQTFLFNLPADPTTVDPHNIVMSPWVDGGTAYAN